MAGENTRATLDGNFKEVYADNLENLTPKGIKFMKDIAFVPREQQPGNNFHQPVLLSHEQGFSYAAGGAQLGTLKDAVAGQTKDATVTGAQIMLRSRMDYEAAARASSGGTRAFRRAVDIVVENMWESAKKRCEISTLYGQSGLGTCESTSINNTINIKAAEWASGIWMGMEGARIEIFTGDVKQGDTATIASVDDANKRITTTGNDDLAIDADDVVYFEGSKSGATENDQMGIHAILANTTGTANGGIEASTFPLWRSTSHPAGGALTISDINNAIAKAVSKGLDEDVNVYVNPGIWNDLQASEIAQRSFTSQPKRGSYQVGSEGLEFYTQSGKISIKSSIYVKEGYAYVLPTQLWKRVGATDLTFNLPDRGDEFFLHVHDAAAYELRCYSNQAVFTKAPAKSCLITGIEKQ